MSSNWQGLSGFFYTNPIQRVYGHTVPLWAVSAVWPAMEAVHLEMISPFLEQFTNEIGELRGARLAPPGQKQAEKESIN